MPVRVSRSLLAAVAVALCAALVPAAAQAKNAEPTVMTRNLYLGADLTPLLAAASSGNPLAVPTVAGQTVAQILANDFPTRAQAIAGEVAAERPDLIGLQEVAKYTTGPFNDPAPATTTFLDYLPILQAALAARGLDYDVVAGPTPESDNEAPAFLGANPASWRDVRLVLSNVILARGDRTDLQVRNARSGVFANQITALGLPLMRNWQAVDAALGKKDFVFLNTHLEAYSGNEAVRTLQAGELVAGPLRSTKPVIAVGDFNSDPGSAVSGGAYAVLTDRSRGKLRDAWVATHPGDPGLTCCRPEDLHGIGALDQRLDLVLTAPASVKALSADIVGEDLADRIAGLWPCDLAGVVATLRVP
jgi:endonuclease/exonuclease/phosphatase family metal-dependent hydrolase